jgi:hypothetical protein
MDAIRRRRTLGIPTVVRFMAALAAMTQLVIVTAAPLGERGSSDVAAVHVEPEGTSAHHAHDDLCATCVAMHLLWTPPREPAQSIGAPAHSQRQSDQRGYRSRAGLAILLARAPPV